MKYEIGEGQRQMILLALQQLKLRRPGWDYAVGEIEKVLGGQLNWPEYTNEDHINELAGKHARAEVELERKERLEKPYALVYAAISDALREALQPLSTTHMERAQNDVLAAAVQWARDDNNEAENTNRLIEAVDHYQGKPYEDN